MIILWSDYIIIQVTSFLSLQISIMFTYANYVMFYVILRIFHIDFLTYKSLRVNKLSSKNLF